MKPIWATSRIPLAAVGRVRADLRTVEVTLTTPDGTEPTVHLVKGVNWAIAAAFAEAVNESLPERSEGEVVVDGSTLVTTRSLRRPREDPFLRKLTWSACGTGLALVALSAAVGIAVGVSPALGVLLVGAVGWGAVWFGGGVVYVAWEQWYLQRCGVTVTAEKQEVFLNGGATYAYTDTAGVTHTIYSKPKSTVRVAYHPRKPQTAVVCGPTVETVALGVLGLGLSAFGTACLVGVIHYTLDAFSG